MGTNWAQIRCSGGAECEVTTNPLSTICALLWAGLAASWVVAVPETETICHGDDRHSFADDRTLW